jgi:hypothetical protein
MRVCSGFVTVSKLHHSLVLLFIVLSPELMEGSVTSSEFSVALGQQRLLTEYNGYILLRIVSGALPAWVEQGWVQQSPGDPLLTLEQQHLYRCGHVPLQSVSESSHS